MGIRVNPETLRQQLEMTGQLDFLNLPYHKGILSGETPAVDRRRHRPVPDPRCCSSTRRTSARSASRVWPKILKEICAEENIFVLE